jgi:hypothetical protein
MAVAAFALDPLLPGADYNAIPPAVRPGLSQLRFVATQGSTIHALVGNVVDLWTDQPARIINASVVARILGPLCSGHVTGDVDMDQRPFDRCISMAKLSALDAAVGGAATQGVPACGSIDEAVRFVLKLKDKIHPDVRQLATADLALHETTPAGHVFSSRLESHGTLGLLTVKGAMLDVWLDILMYGGGLAQVADRDVTTNVELVDVCTAIETHCPGAVGVGWPKRINKGVSRLFARLHSKMPVKLKVTMWAVEPDVYFDRVGEYIEDATRREMIDDNIGLVTVDLPLIRKLVDKADEADKLNVMDLLFKQIESAGSVTNLFSWQNLECRLENAKEVINGGSNKASADLVNDVVDRLKMQKELAKPSHGNAGGRADGDGDGAGAPPADDVNYLQTIKSLKVAEFLTALAEVNEHDYVAIVDLALQAGVPFINNVLLGKCKRALRIESGFQKLVAAVNHVAACIELRLTQREERGEFVKIPGGVNFKLEHSRVISMLKGNFEVDDFVEVFVHLQSTLKIPMSGTTLISILTDHMDRNRFQTFLDLLLRSMGQRAGGLDDFFKSFHSAEITYNPFANTGRMPSIACEEFGYMMTEYQRTVASSVAGNEEEYPEFQVESAVNRFEGEVSKARKHHEEVVEDPEGMGALASIARAGGLGLSRPLGSASATDEPPLKRATSEFDKLPVFGEDRNLRVYEANGNKMLCWRRRDNTTVDCWDFGVVTSWHNAVGDNGIKRIMRADALLSIKSTPTARRANAVGATPEQVEEPKNWLQTREQFKRANFRLP